MPQFKSTYNILIKPDEDEVFESKWIDSDKVVHPPNPPWDYGREMTVEDVDIWEVLTEVGHGKGVYASWCPYAEFYMITTGFASKAHGHWEGDIYYNRRNVETYYGPNAQKQVFARAKELGIDLQTHKVWVEDQDMWLYQEPQSNTIFHFNKKL